jgi:hypothetical protein
MFSSTGGFVVGVDDSHRENVLWILIRLLARIKDLEFALGEIANRIVVLVSRNHIEYHLAGGYTEDER